MELGENYDYLMDLREVGDYGGIKEVTTQDARMAVDAADAIIRAVEKQLPKSDE